MRSRLHGALTALALVAVAAAGCGSPAPEFRQYATFQLKKEKETDVTFTSSQRENVDTILASLFGTPNKPLLPKLEGVDLAPIADLAKLRMAAGPVGSDESGRPHGLYREHCAHCHGVTGDGNGPTAAFLNPYPRDYRRGMYKFKSTKVGEKPTHEDLHKIVYDGIPGTAMPSFKLLPAEDLDAVVHYVRYLSIRGETERGLLNLLSEADENAMLVDVQNAAARTEQLAAINEMIAGIVQKWIAADEQAVPIPQRPTMTDEELAASQKHGRELFYGTVANCVKCHGDSALGDGQLTDYDEWTKEFMTGTDASTLAPYVAVGLPQPRNIRPRNLRLGVFRGGHRPIDIYWRVRVGIEGTPMPAATLANPDDPASKGLTENDIWDIVNYVQSLQYERISNPYDAPPANLRERM